MKQVSPGRAGRRDAASSVVPIAPLSGLPASLRRTAHRTHSTERHSVRTSDRRDTTSKRFLPPDPRVEEPYLLTPQMALRVAILGFVALALFAVLFLRLWALQVLAGDKYRAVAN